MWFNLKKILFCCAVVLQIFGQFAEVESRYAKKRGGKRKSMMGGFLAGGLAGGISGVVAANMLNKPKEVHHYHHMADSGTSTSNAVVINPIPVAPKPLTTIEKGETFANGCYKQTVKEADPNDSARFIKTEQLICPQTMPSTVNNHLLPAVAAPQPQAQATAPVVHLAQVPAQIEPGRQEVESTAATTVPPPYTALLQPFQPDVVARIPTNTSNTLLTPAAVAVHPLPPVVNTPISVIAAPPQVIVLSKTTGFYDGNKRKGKNAATNLFGNKFVIMAAVFLALRLL